MEEFSKLNESIYEKAGAYPFEYSEKQLQSVVFNSFVNIPTYPYAEYPVDKKKGTEVRSGWVDFWVHYNGDTVFLIEYKHTDLSICGSEKSLNSTKRKWRKAVTDVKAITNESIRKMELGNTNLFKLAMMTVRLDSKSETSDKIISEEEANQKFEKLWKYLKPPPHWGFSWILRKEPQQKRLKWENKYWNYPAVYLYVWSQGPINPKS